MTETLMSNKNLISVTRHTALTFFYNYFPLLSSPSIHLSIPSASAGHHSFPEGSVPFAICPELVCCSFPPYMVA